MRHIFGGGDSTQNVFPGEIENRKLDVIAILLFRFVRITGRNKSKMMRKLDFIKYYLKSQYGDETQILPIVILHCY